jgi:hypothetical protein
VDALSEAGTYHYPPGNAAQAHGKFLFVDSMRELWASDGSAAGTFHVQGVESVKNLVNNGLGDVFFYGFQAGSGGELWRYDATEPPSAEVVGRRVFYNNSAYDGPDGAAANANDDLAFDRTRTPLLPGGAAQFNNISSYTRGLNGIMVDIAGLPAEIDLEATDFIFRTGTSSNQAAWTYAAAPADVAVRPGAGAGGSDRITIVWRDYDPYDPATRAQQAVANAWLEVTVNASQRTGLLRPDVFYFGSLIGETNAQVPEDRRVVNLYDYMATRSKTGTTAAVTNPLDFNRDKKVDSLDVSVVRSNMGRTLPLIVIPESGAPISAATVAATASVRQPSSVATELVRRRTAYRPL